MGAVASFTLPDAQATPVTHTFTPTEQDKNGVWWWEDADSGAAIGRCRVSLQIVRPAPNVARLTQNAQRVYRVKVGIHVPRLETLGAAASGYTAIPQVNHVLRCQTEFILPENAAKVDRQTMREFLSNIMQRPNFYNATDDLVGVF